MTEPDTLKELIDANIASHATNPAAVSAADLGALWAELFPGDDGPTRAGLRAFEATLDAALAGGEGDESLNLRAGGWVIDVSNGIVRSALATALLSGVLTASGAIGLIPLVAPAVLPLLFDVHRVRLTRAQEVVHAQLCLTAEARAGGMTPDELYAKLPHETRKQLSMLDFVDFLDLVRRAGLTGKADDGHVVLHAPNKARLKVTIV